MPPRKPRTTVAVTPAAIADLSLEAACGPGAVVCGIDEVGRGPLAGPVTAAAVVLPAVLPDGLALAIRDSKALSEAARDRLAPEIRRHALAYAIAEASVEEIDDLNILRATLVAMRRAFDGLALAGVVPTHALVDGKILPDLPCPGTAVVKGDSRSLSIAAASIIAKVDRDSVMRQLHNQFPGYGWDRNAGYPTASHREALKRLGATPHHRTSFSPVREVLGLTT
ncbi:ribonuclease HII [Azospirillum fermentarium]|nr:ribonuclease HII [Azospirillum fermentarium]